MKRRHKLDSAVSHEHQDSSQTFLPWNLILVSQQPTSSIKLTTTRRLSLSSRSFHINFWPDLQLFLCDDDLWPLCVYSHLKFSGLVKEGVACLGTTADYNSAQHLYRRRSLWYMWQTTHSSFIWERRWESFCYSFGFSSPCPFTLRWLCQVVSRIYIYIYTYMIRLTDTHLLQSILKVSH